MRAAREKLLASEKPSKNATSTRGKSVSVSRCPANRFCTELRVRENSSNAHRGAVEEFVETAQVWRPHSRSSALRPATSLQSEPMSAQGSVARRRARPILSQPFQVHAKVRRWHSATVYQARQNSIAKLVRDLSNRTSFPRTRSNSLFDFGAGCWIDTSAGIQSAPNNMRTRSIASVIA